MSMKLFFANMFNAAYLHYVSCDARSLRLYWCSKVAKHNFRSPRLIQLRALKIEVNVTSFL